MRSSATADVSWLHKDRLEAGRVQQSKRCIDAGREWMDVLGTVCMFYHYQLCADSCTWYQTWSLLPFVHI